MEHHPTIGPSSAEIVVTLFSDFQCPFCQEQATILAAERQQYGRNMRVVFRNLPLEMHSWARAAAESGACVNEQSGEAFWALHDLFFAHQKEITNGTLEDFIRSHLSARNDVDLDVYRACMREQKGATQVDRDIQFASQLNLRGTPTGRAFTDGNERC